MTAEDELGFGQKKILFVDDEPEATEVARIVAENHGFTCLTADDPVSAKTIIEQEKPYSIWCDGLDGDCFDIHELAKRAQVKFFVVYSNNDTVNKEARLQGIPTLPKMSELSVVENYIRNLKIPV